jgi:hypothetical protein
MPQVTDQARVIPDPAVEPTIKLARAARILGMSTRAAHYAADRGQIPTVRVGRLRFVPTREFLETFRLGGA